MRALWVIVMVAWVGVVHANTEPQDDINQAIKECQTMVDAKTNRTAFDACMKAKGFERPKDQ